MTRYIGYWVAQMMAGAQLEGGVGYSYHLSESVISGPREFARVFLLILWRKGLIEAYEEKN